MKKRILSLVLCAAMLLSMCLFLGAGVTDDGETCKITVNYIYQSDKTPVAPTAVLEARKGETLTQGIDLPQRDSFTPQLEKNYKGVSIDNLNNQLVFNEYSVTGNVTINVLYVAGQATYTVEFHFQNIDNDEYTKDETKTRTVEGDVNAYTEAVATAYPGFTAEKFKQQRITPDGKTCIKIYYTRNYYMVQFNSNGGVNGPAPVYAKYGAQLSVPAAPTKTGYRFQGWYYNGEQLVDGKTVDGNVTYTAAWEAESENASVTVVYWGQNANDNEYSYYGAVELPNQPVNQEINWDTVRDTVAYVCGKTAHTHSAACGLNCSHVHDATCYGTSGKSVDTDNDKEFWNGQSSVAVLAQKLNGGLKNGYVYGWEQNAKYASSKTYYLYLNGQFYKIGTKLPNYANANVEQSVSDVSGDYPDYLREYSVVESKIPCKHTHDDSCYACGLVEHTHSDRCKAKLSKKMDSSLWTYEKSDTVTVDAAGNTVMNVYYTRTKFTLTFVLDRAESYGTYTKKLTAPWGKKIESNFDQIVAEEKSNLEKYNENYRTERHLAGWEDSTTRKYTDKVMIMPSVDKTLTATDVSGSTESSMYYYAADLQGNYPEKPSFTITFAGSDFVVTEDEYYEWEGFEINKEKSTKTGKKANGATFYYDRKAYDLKFFSGNNAVPVKSERPKFEQPLNEFAAYQPEMPPQGVESDAVFAGWYLNPQCTGEQYDLSTHKMPANNIALYAKWVNCSYTVRTYTDSTCKEPCSYEGAIDTQSVLKHETAKAPPDPTKSGNVFVGWFYEDENGKEQPFSFQMEITKDYNLYPKWSDKADVSYIVQYRNKATNEEIIPADTFTTRIGNQVTITAKTISGYFPEESSFSETIDVADKVVTVWYTSATVKYYTVRYVEIVNGQQKALADPVPRTTSSMRVVEQAKTIPGYTAKQFEIAHDVTAGEDNFEIVFEYVKYVTINYVPLEGGKVDQGTETLIRTTGEAHGSTATPNDGYKFVGWYDNRECTGNPVSTEATFVPQKVDRVYADATYYAKFELDVFDLTIKKTGTHIDLNQTFVFRVRGNNNNHDVDMQVVITGTNKQVIKNLPMGNYTITEDTNWSWKYTPVDGSATQELKVDSIQNGAATVIFENKNKGTNWLTSIAKALNVWKNNGATVERDRTN